MKQKRYNPLYIFKVRAEVRAVLFGAGMYHDADAAILPLMNDAWHAGLVDKFGTDYLMAIVDKAFAPFCEAE